MLMMLAPGGPHLQLVATPRAADADDRPAEPQTFAACSNGQSG